MSNIKSSIKTGCFLFVVYGIILFLFPYKTFILSGIAVFLFAFLRIFSRKSFLNLAHNVFSKIKEERKNGELEGDRATEIAYQPYMGLIFFGLLSSAFYVEGFFTESGLIAVTFFMYNIIDSKLKGFKKANKEIVPNYLKDYVTKEEWGQFDDKSKVSMHSFDKTTKPSVWYWGSVKGVLIAALILANEFYFHWDTWSWIGF